MAELNICEKTSEEVIEVKCGLCSPDIIVKAYGFCKNCSEHLCETCFKGHRRIPLCRNHDLVKKKDMPEDGSLLKSKDICTETCSIHDDKVIEFLCEVHSVFGCSICIFKDHRQCKGLVCISEVSDGIYDSQEFKDLKTDIDVADSRNNDNRNDLKENKSKVEKASQRATKDTSDFATRLKDLINKLENVTVNKIAEIKENEIERLNSLSNKREEYGSKISLLRKSINDSQSVGARCDSFIAMKKANSELKTVSCELETLDQQTILRNYVDEGYKANPDLVNVFDTVTDLGSMSLTRGHSPNELNIQDEEDESGEHQKEATLVYKIKDISKLKNSKQSTETKIRGLPWSISAVEKKTHLGFYVKCNVDANNRSWSCKASADMKIINQKGSCKELTHVFSHAHDDWGFHQFIKLDALLDPANGFCVDDSIILEARIKADKPEGI